MAAVAASTLRSHDLAAIFHRMDDWLAKLGRELDNRLSWTGLRERSTLVAQARAVDTALHDLLMRWDQQRSDLRLAEMLAGTFDGQLILLVFGKFNAGKSAFCNLLAERFAGHGEQVRYFHIDADRIVDTPAPFEEGETESTARLQGVRLCERLILLDTPGLHSVTAQNAALTRRFIDGADGVLWLSSSASPGQVQELDELSRELHRSKPLLPVLTRSDVFEEDEIDGVISKLLRNKTEENRTQQEADVHARAHEKLRSMGLDAALLMPPVSVSAHAARQQGLTPPAMAEAGFERLYAALSAIIEPALAYKQRKPAEIPFHHLEEDVLGALHAEVSPQLDRLEATLQSEQHLLDQVPVRAVAAMWRRVAPVLPGLLEEHAPSRDVGAVCDALSQAATQAVNGVLDEMLADHVLPADLRVEVAVDEGVGYDEFAVHVDSGNLTPSRDELGRPATARTCVVDVSDERLYAALQHRLSALLTRQTAQAVDHGRASLQQLGERAERLRDVVRAHQHSLADIKRELRLEPPGAADEA
ncbi:MAG TPA: dynamin family protein [Ilumatobacter sp.]|nr:dynamin family protein [Ilumatobacter sp.]